MRVPNSLQSIDAATLTPLVRQALGSETVEITDWVCEPNRGGMSTASVYRFAGRGHDGTMDVPWSLILKVIRPTPEDSDSYDWRREALAYRSGLLADLPGGLVAPRCFGISEQPGGDHWLWLEEVNDAFDHRWTLEHYAMAARHCGQFNGAYLAGRPMPPYPWVTRSDVRQFYATIAPAMERLQNLMSHPLLARAFPPDVAQGILRLWSQRKVLAETLGHLPKILCHGDAGKGNLFLRCRMDGGYETVAIDWAGMHVSEIGADMVILALGPLYTRGFEMGQAAELESMVFEGYLQGLRDLCDEFGALLVFDEVMTGFRVAYGGAQALYGVRPHLTTMGKVIGGGMPVGAVGGPKDILSHLSPVGPVYQAGTLSGNPVAMAAGLATLELVQADGFYEALEAKSAALAAGLAEAAEAELPGQVTFNRVGSMMSAFFTPDPVTDYPSATASNLDAFTAYFQHMLAAGIYLAPSQFEAMFVSAAHSDDDVAKTVDAAAGAFAAAAKAMA